MKYQPADLARDDEQAAREGGRIRLRRRARVLQIRQSMWKQGMHKPQREGKVGETERSRRSGDEHVSRDDIAACEENLVAGNKLRQRNLLPSKRPADGERRRWWRARRTWRVRRDSE